MTRVVLSWIVAVAVVGAMVRVLPAQVPTGRGKSADYWVYGAGSDSCGTWLQHRRNIDASLRSTGNTWDGVTQVTGNDMIPLALERGWVLGYVSGAGTILTGLNAGLAETDVDAIIAWTDQHCGGHPLDSLEQATATLLEELVKRKRHD